MLVEVNQSKALDRPLVSVVIPCFNQGKYLRDCISSIFSGSLAHAEVIVVNDGSTDETEQVAESFGNRIKYIYKQNAGLSAARNTGIRYATGEFIQFLDADDYLFPETLCRFKEAVNLFPGGDVYFGSWDLVDTSGGLIRHATPSARAAEDFLHQLLRSNIFPCHAAIVRRVVLEQSGEFDIRLRGFEDWDLWLRMAAAGAQFVPAPGAVVAYRQYPGSMSRQFNRMRDSGLAVLRKSELSHGMCKGCRIARAHGRSALRACLYADVLRPELKAIWVERGLGQMLLRLYDVCRADPPIATTILRASIRARLWSA